jgi:hypothetical protein
VDVKKREEGLVEAGEAVEEEVGVVKIGTGIGSALNTCKLLT